MFHIMVFNGTIVQSIDLNLSITIVHPNLKNNTLWNRLFWNVVYLYRSFNRVKPIHAVYCKVDTVSNTVVISYDLSQVSV